jgi:hypothetical protein
MPSRSEHRKVVFPSPVHPPELSSKTPTIGGGEITLADGGLADTFRHSGWRRNRTLIYASLYRTQQTHSRLSAFSSCGWRSFVYRTVDPPHVYRLAGSSCRDRFCVPCARDRSRCISTNILAKMRGDPARFATLTLKHSDAPLADQVARLYKSFQKLRMRAAWKRHVSGGCAFIEVKWIANTEQWHPHLHCILHGRYFPKMLLSAQWHAVTGDSFVTDIRSATDEGKIAAYVAKYASKPVNDTFLARPDLLDEVIAAFRGRRLCHTFGTWRGLKLTECPSDRDWESIGSFHDVCIRAIDGDAEATDAIDMICGDRRAEMLGAVRFARPPPIVTPCVDNRF